MTKETLKRKVYVYDEKVCLCQYVPESDDKEQYDCWLDEDTQKGYNFAFKDTFEEFSAGKRIKSRFIAAISRKEDNAIIGCIFVSPENTLPDLAIMIYKPFRGMGYGTQAFSLGVKYCFEGLGLDKIFAGCYPDNEKSKKMLQKCGFVLHPEGNVVEKHYRTGEPVRQLDFVKCNDSKSYVQRVEPNVELWNRLVVYAENCPWSAGPYLAKMMREKRLTEWESVFVALERDEITGFCTLTKKDCMPHLHYTPYIGFLFVGEAFRGMRLSERLIKSALEYAKMLGFSTVYLTSGEHGLYEKYGFVKIEDVINCWGHDEQLFSVSV